MAKGTNIGFLNFGIDGDNKELMKKLAEAKKEALSVQQVMQDVMRTRTQVNSTQTGNDARRNALNQARIDEITNRSLERQRLIQEQIATQTQRTELLRQRLLSQSTSSQNSLTRSIELTNKTMFNQKALLQQMSNALGIYFSIYQVGAFVKELAMVSGEFEKQRASLAAILQDSDAANKLFGQIKDLAVISPFNFKELTGYAKQLSAFSIPTNEIYDTMKRLADVSAGLGVDMNRIILAYGQVRSASVLRGQELRQFTEAGIPLVDELAKKFEKLSGEVVSAGDVFDKISNREVPFAMIKEIFTDLTSEGGKFFEMQEIQSATLAGKISNLRDSYDIMLDSIGSANSGLLKGSVDVLVDLMNNWEKLWSIIKGLIITYGTYKAAIFLLNVAQTANVAINELVIASAGLVNRQQAAQILLTDKATASWGRFNKALAANKYALIVTALVAIGYALKTAYDESTRFDRELNELTSKIKGNADVSAASLANLVFRLKNVTEYSTEYKSIIDEINKKYGEYLPNLLKETDSLSVLEDKLKGVTNAIYEKAKAQTYAQSSAKIEEELTDNISKAYDSAIKSLSEKPLLGYSQFVLSKDQANKVVTDMFSAIRNSPEIYKESDNLEKLISETLGKAFEGRNIDTSFKALSDFPQLDGLIDGVKNYAEAMGSVSDKQDDVRQKTEALYGTNESYEKSISAIKERYDQLNKDSDKLLIGDKMLIDEIKLRYQVKMLTEMLDIYKQFGQYELAKNVQKDIDAINNANSGWRNELQLLLGNTITIQTDTNLPDVIKEMREKAKAFKEEIEDQKPLLIKLGFDFDKNAFPFPANDIAMAVANNYIANQKNLDNINKAAKELNVTLDNKKKKSEKDKFTDDLKDQVELIKQAKAEYEKLLNVMSSDEAAKKLKSIEPYKNIDINNLSDSGYVDYLNSQLKKIEKRNTDTAKNVRIAWNKELAQVQVEKITDDAKKALDKLEKTLSQDKERFNLYKQIFGITGDKAQAAQMAFGDPNKIVGEYLDLLKSSFKAQTNISFSDFINLDDDSKNKLLLQENVKKLAEDIQSTEWTNKADFSKQMAELVVQYRTVDEQITAIREKGEATRLEILKNTDNVSQDLVEARLRANREAISKGIADLTNGALQATESYQRLFGEIGNISEKELGYLIKKWKDIISQARKNTDGSLTVTVDGKNFTTTEKEIASFSKRIIKSETELRNRNPFKALKTSLDELSNNRSKIKEIENEIKGLEDSMAMASNSKANGSNNPINDLILSTSGAKITNLKSKLADLGAQGATSFMKVGSAIGSIGQSASEIGQSLSGMFDAFGNESMADTVGFIGELADSASQIGEGLASKDPIKVIKGIASGITSIANFHDKKLDRAIKRSQLEVKKLGNAYNEIQRTIARQLSAISEAQSKEMIENQEKQIAELRKQQQAERDKKKTDDSVVLDLEDQINEAKDKLKYFYEDLASEQFGINVKEWAGTLADSLVEAFSSGENAAKSFDKSVADIMRNVVKNMISLQVIQPAMEKLRDYLFGDNGVLTDGELSTSDAAGLVGQLSALKGSIGDAKSIWDALNAAAKQAGISLEDTAKQDTLSKGIQALTEDTSNIITSYINSMRADLAAQLAEICKISLFSENCTTTFALMLAELTKIQVNTYNTANNTREIADTVKDTNAILKSVTVKNGAVGINMY